MNLEVQNQTSEKNICLRPVCVKYKSTLRNSHCCERVILKIHHYFYNRPSLKDTDALFNAAELFRKCHFSNSVELSDASEHILYLQKYASDWVFSVSKKLPSLVNRFIKPTLYFWAYIIDRFI